MRINSIAFRLIAGAALWIGGALVLSGFMLAALFGDHVKANFDKRIGVLLESLIAVSEIGPDGNLILERAPGEPLFDQPYSGWYWQISVGERVVLRSRSLWDVTLKASTEAGAGGIRRYRLAGPQDQRLLALERDIALPDSKETFHYAVAANLAVIDAERRPFDSALGWSLGIIWAGLMAAVFIQTRFGLRPLGRMRTALADVRAGRADRLGGVFPAEITPLAEELNAHLGQIAEIVARARTHVGNLAHALKTPLSVLSNEAGQADGPLADTVRRQTAIMSRRVDHHLMRARTAATGGLIGVRTELMPVLEDLRRTLQRIHRDRNITIEVDGPADAVFRGDRQDVEEIIGNIMDNGCKWARSLVRARLVRDTTAVRLTIEDDGPGLAPDKRAAALARGGRLDESVPGSGLGLAIVGEIVGLYGGTFGLDDSELGGLRVEVTLPAAEIQSVS